MIKKFRLIIALLSICSFIAAMHAPRKTNKRKLVDTQQNKENKKRKIESQQDVSDFINKEIMESVFNPKSDPAPKVANYLENTSFSNILFACKLLKQDQEEPIKKLFIEKHQKQLMNIIAPGSDSFIAGAKLISKYIPCSNLDDPQFITNWKISDNNKYLCTDRDLSPIFLWDLNSGWKKEFDNPPDFNNEYLVEQVEDYFDNNYIDIWNLSNKSRIGSIKSDPVKSIAISSDSKYIATAKLGSVDLWDLKSLEKIKEFKTKVNGTGNDCSYNTYFNFDNKYLIATAINNGSGEYPLIIVQNIWEIKSGQAIKEFDETFHALAHHINSLFSQNNNLILKLEPDLYEEELWFDNIDKASIFNLKKNQAYLLKGLDARTLTRTYFSPDSRFLLTVHWLIRPDNEKSKIDIYDAETGTFERTLVEQKGRVNHCCFNNDGKLIATANDDGLVQIFDFIIGRQIKCFDHSKQIQILFESEISSKDKKSIHLEKVEFSLDNKIIIEEWIYNYRPTIAFWDIENDQLLRSTGYSSSILSKDNKLIVVGPVCLNNDNSQSYIQVDDLANSWIMPQLDLATILFLIKLINSPKGNIVKNAKYRDYYDKLPIEVKRFVKKYYEKKIIKLYLKNNDLTNIVHAYLACRYFDLV